MSRIISIAILGLLMSAHSVVGQDTQENKHRREGFWFQGGLGAGGLKVSCDILGAVECPDKTEAGGIARIALGGRLSPAIHLGGSLDLWAKSEGEITVSYGSTSLLVMVYPVRTSGFWLNFGTGYSLYTEDAPGAQFEVESISFVSGLGYDIRVGPMLSLTPFLDGVVSAPGKIKLNGVKLPDSDATPMMLGGGLAITVH